MTRPFDHPASIDMLDRLVSVIKANPIFLVPSAQIIFVCGGPIGGSLTVRQQFLDWAAAELPNCKVFVAEEAARDLLSDEQSRPLNLSKFEKFLANVADCVIVFPESVGSWAETGYFSAEPDVRQKCLIANCFSEQRDSFLNLGPIHQIEQSSRYKKVLIDFFRRPPDFSPIKQRLDTYARKTRRRLTIDTFADLRGVEQAAFILYLIGLFPSVDMRRILDIIGRIFRKWPKDRIQHLLSLLISAKYIERLAADSAFFSVIPPIRHLLEVRGVDPDAVRAEHLEFYSRYAPDYIPG
jgi:hypothetical protein